MTSSERRPVFGSPLAAICFDELAKALVETALSACLSPETESCCSTREAKPPANQEQP
jgi:hypothetical protein